MATPGGNRVLNFRSKEDWSGKDILITGGTGSFGKKCVETLLAEHKPNRIIVFSRDELKQYEMQTGGFTDPRLRFFVGDIRDKDRLIRAMKGVNVVIHAAALKQVPTCEYNPMEAILTNIIGTRNVVEAALDSGVQRLIALSTDKAVNPVNLYGATKLCAEKLVVQSNAYSGKGISRFSCVRYGNVVGSRGSVVPKFLEQRVHGKITITDDRMSRFWITLDQGVKFVLSCLETMMGGEVFVPKIPSMKVSDLAVAVAPECKIETIGIRPGEKLHEILVSDDESRNTIELEDRYIVKPLHPWWQEKQLGGKPVEDGFRYASNNNDWWLDTKELQKLINTSLPEMDPNRLLHASA